MMRDMLKDIKNYEGYYQIDDSGYVVRSAPGQRTRPGKVLKLETTANGYNRIMLSKKNSKKRFLVHRLVADAFIPNPDNKPCINHKNGIKTDNRSSNLEWCDWSHNMRHAVTNGLHVAPRVAWKLSNNEIEMIRSLKTKHTQKQLATMFGVNQCHISRILNDKRRNKPCHK